MPTAPLGPCTTPLCPNRALPDSHGKCADHRQTTGQRGYGPPHQRARLAIAVSLPAPCGYCGEVIRPGERFVAAHRIDGRPDAGWMASHGACNERAKGGAV